jgi:phosphoserine phosphatase
MSDYRAVLFDLDGTLTPVRSVWQHLHESLGLWDAGADRHQASFERGEISYEKLCELDASVWKGMAEADLREITDRIPYRPGARECVQQLIRAGLMVGVVSTGLTLLAERVHHDLDMAYTIANRLVARKGLLTGEVKVNVQLERKGEAVDLFCSQFGVAHQEVIAVGDSDGDISMFDHCGFSVALNPESERTARSASATHVGESLLELVTLLPIEWTEPQ